MENSQYKSSMRKSNENDHEVYFSLMVLIFIALFHSIIIIKLYNNHNNRMEKNCEHDKSH